MYFDYKAQQTQTPIDIVTGLLKQLLTQLADIPEELECLYDECTRADKKPDQSTLTQLLASVSQKFSTVYMIFDALDECSDSHQKDMSGLFAQLQQSSHRLLISFRSHLNKLGSTLFDIRIFQISANESDLKQYVTSRLEEKGNKRR